MVGGVSQLNSGTAAPSAGAEGSLGGNPAPVVAFFDLDKTIIAASTAFVYGREFFHKGLISSATAMQFSLAQAMYLARGHSDEKQDALKNQLAALVRGWDVAEIEAIAQDTLEQVIIPTIYAEARELISLHKLLGHRVVIISASARQLVAPIARRLGVDEVVATELGVAEGRFTGEVEFYCKGAAKAEAVHALAHSHGVDPDRCFAYSDSFTDLPMLLAVGNPVAVNPDKALRTYAEEHGWDIRVFKQPVPLQHQFTPLNTLAKWRTSFEETFTGPINPGLRIILSGSLAGSIALCGWWLRQRRRVR